MIVLKKSFCAEIEESILSIQLRCLLSVTIELINFSISLVSIFQVVNFLKKVKRIRNGLMAKPFNL